MNKNKKSKQFNLYMIRHIQNLETSDIFYISNRLKLIKLFLYVITFNIPRFQSQLTTLNNLPLEPTPPFRQTKILQQRNTDVLIPWQPSYQKLGAGYSPVRASCRNLFRRIECSATAPRNRYLAREKRAPAAGKQRGNNRNAARLRFPDNLHGVSRGERRRARVRALPHRPWRSSNS